jgi:hypothetical protein
MHGIVIHCPNKDCQKPLIKDACLPPTTNFKIKCYHCGNIILIMSDYKGIKLKDCTINTDVKITLM